MRFLIFDPYSDVWVHSFPTALVGEALASVGDEVHVVRCKGCLNRFCIAMSARGLTPDASRHQRAIACRSCMRRSEVLSSSFDFVEHHVDNLVTPLVQQRIGDLIQTVHSDNWDRFEVDGLPMGRLAGYEFFLTYKLNSLRIPDDLWPIYVNFLTNALLTHFAVNSLLDQQSFDAILVYNGLYSTNRVVTLNGRKRGIPSWALHAGSHVVDKFSTIAMYDSNLLPVLAFNSDHWKIEQQRPLSISEIRLVERHIAELFKGRNLFVYSQAASQSAPAQIYERFHISPGAKVLLATLSSGDEIVAARLAGLFPEDNPADSVFEDAVDWIRFLVEEVKRRRDLHLLIRVHPREFPNKREGQRSQNSFLLEEIFKDLPENVSVNWPSDNVSLYDLFGITDVVLNSTSSAGLEFSAMGAPVVVHDTHFMLSYDPEINRQVLRRSDYMAVVDEALRNGWSIENSRKAFRWWAFVFASLAVPVDEGFSYPSNGYTSSKKSFRADVFNWILRLGLRIAPPVRERRDAMRRRTLRCSSVFIDAVSNSQPFAFAPRNGPFLTQDQEREAIDLAVNRLLRSIGGEPPRFHQDAKDV